jgi:glutaconate CoA-transferase subunit B
MEITSLELIAILLSRELKDGEIVVTGNNSLVPLCAAKSAQILHAPNLVIIAGSLGVVNPVDPVMDNSCAYFKSRKGESILPYSLIDVDFLLCRKMADVFFLSGMQVDQYGNVNLVCIGNYHKPKVRGPGSIGAGFSRLSKKIYIYIEKHNRNTLVERVDFVSAQGFIPGEKYSTDDSGLIVGAPRLVITPLCVMDFDEEKLSMRLRSIHRGVTLKEVIKETGFELIIPKKVYETKELLPEEINTIRAIDSKGLLRNL